MELTDDQILKRLAEIEGLDVLINGVLREVRGQFFQLWNPLERWEDCGQLAEKHGVHISAGERGDPDPEIKRAICLEIIEAHDGTN
jgi:hypothetical protein